MALVRSERWFFNICLSVIMNYIFSRKLYTIRSLFPGVRIRSNWNDINSIFNAFRLYRIIILTAIASPNSILSVFSQHSMYFCTRGWNILHIQWKKQRVFSVKGYICANWLIFALAHFSTTTKSSIGVWSNLMIGNILTSEKVPFDLSVKIH